MWEQATQYKNPKANHYQTLLFQYDKYLQNITKITKTTNTQQSQTTYFT